MEQVLDKLSQEANVNDLFEEISIFQNKIKTEVEPTLAKDQPETELTVEGSESLINGGESKSKLKQLRAEVKSLQKELETQKESNSNHVFINEKLNKALKRSETRNESLALKMKSLSSESVILKKEIMEFRQPTAAAQPVFAESEALDMDDPFVGDVSSICVKAD